MTYSTSGSFSSPSANFTTGEDQRLGVITRRQTINLRLCSVYHLQKHPALLLSPFQTPDKHNIKTKYIKSLKCKEKQVVLQRPKLFKRILIYIL